MMPTEELVVTTRTDLLVTPEEKAFILKALAELRLNATLLPDKHSAPPEHTKENMWEVIRRGSALLSALGQNIQWQKPTGLRTTHHP